eukprot:12061911-Karenia_brevis.AAC.1
MGGGEPSSSWSVLVWYAVSVTRGSIAGGHSIFYEVGTTVHHCLAKGTATTVFPDVTPHATQQFACMERKTVIPLIALSSAIRRANDTKLHFGSDWPPVPSRGPGPIIISHPSIQSDSRMHQ